MTTDAIDDFPSQDPMLMEPEDTAWPRVIGVLSIIYAVAGMLCQVTVAGWTFFSEKLLAMGGMDIEIPASMKYPTIVLGFLVFCLGIFMLSGSAALLRRRRHGVSRLKTWAVLRLVLIVIGLGVTLFTLPGQLDFQRQVREAQNEQLRQSGRSDMVTPFDEDSAWVQVIATTGIFTAIVSAYPLFIGFYLSRRKIADELQHWM
ncbi:MAG: tetraspanin family protein [Planctomycetes bacterium]|nr:tetraspanin family protein [Planctomycetota bacterium]